MRPYLLYVTRHAKSSWDDPASRDFDRTLNQRGLANAPQTGQQLLARGIHLDSIVSSPAVRAKATAQLIAHAMDYSPENILFQQRIYEASSSDLASVVAQLDPAWYSVLLCGHNPGLTDFITKYSDLNLDNLPTAAVAALQFELPWKDIHRQKGKCLFFYSPRQGFIEP